MTGRIFRSIITVAIVVLAASFVIEFWFMYQYFGGWQEAQLEDELGLAAAAVEGQGAEYLSRLDAERYRLTWVDVDGTVLYDTQVEASTMGNHADREEIKEAWETGLGGSFRYSDTLTQETLYQAVALADGTVLRISISRATYVALVLGTIPPVLLVAAMAILFSILLAASMARKIVEPLNELDLERPLENDAYKEVAPLLNRIDQQHREISDHIQELRRRADEFEQITGSMQEGLVLLSAKGRILSINPAAGGIFGADERSVGEDFLSLNCGQELGRAVEGALLTGRGELREERDGREYQFRLSRIESDGAVLGVLLLAFDISDRAHAERNRREFTANVSHELKSPLQSIIGSAELMQQGLVQPQDAPRFLERIHKEASRLMALIEDIIGLSQLDEGGEMPREDVELASLAEEAAASLQNAAAEKGVSLSVAGRGRVYGVRRLLYEIVHNLMDNAVKYNRQGGSVDVSISETEDEVLLLVRDGGIGIPPEHQDRVFERFYRVDKSHSKKSGGTGLGLSIVKHAVQYHQGRLALYSQPGQGTAITAAFPKG